jgi:DNA gyrase inhibitor GyrI|tara:strand:+ start:110 stop:460 length:351 start_codon:yes stop_codon:yes gene_type:complete
MSDNAGEATADLLKEMVGELRHLRQRVEQLETENATLSKAVDDPETLMKKAGWLKAVTPLSAEVYDPLNREAGDAPSFVSGFGTEMLSKGMDELKQWQEMEDAMPSQTSPSSIKYR